jgi:hypothetical protein
MNLDEAARFIQWQLAHGRLLPRHIAVLVLRYQELRELGPDGMPGGATIGEIERDLARLKPESIEKCWPLPLLPDHREPRITSRFKTHNPGRPRHNGVDLFYAYDPSKDPPVPVGDGGAARGKDGKPKWFIPDGLCALAAADGVVTRASRIPTGYRVAVEHLDGYETIYCHLRGLLVQVGQQVKRGTKLGEVGDNPQDIDAEHLHFELTKAGRYEPEDPEPWLETAEYLAS